MHNHTPIECKHLIVRFLCFLFSPVKVCRYYVDGTEICAECKVYIALPLVYSSPVVKGIYILAGGVIGLIMVQLPYLRVLVAFLLAAAFHHIASSFIFAFYPWEMYDPQIRSTKSVYRDATKELNKKSVCISIGLVIGAAYAIFVLF